MIIATEKKTIEGLYRIVLCWLSMQNEEKKTKWYAVRHASFSSLIKDGH
jgi:hypothetical protein